MKRRFDVLVGGCAFKSVGVRCCEVCVCRDIGWLSSSKSWTERDHNVILEFSRGSTSYNCHLQRPELKNTVFSVSSLCVCLSINWSALPHSLLLTHVGDDSSPWTFSASRLISSDPFLRTVLLTSFLIKQTHSPIHSLTHSPLLILLSRLPQKPRHQKRQLQCLLLIQPRITKRRIVQTQVLLPQPFRTAHTLRHRLARQLQMHAT